MKRITLIIMTALIFCTVAMAQETPPTPATASECEIHLYPPNGASDSYIAGDCSKINDPSSLIDVVKAALAESPRSAVQVPTGIFRAMRSDSINNQSPCLCQTIPNETIQCYCEFGSFKLQILPDSQGN